MAQLNSQQRSNLPPNQFAIPNKAPASGSYPINDPAHARNALSRVSASGTPPQQAQVRQAVKQKYPSIGDKQNAAKKIMQHRAQGR